MRNAFHLRGEAVKVLPGLAKGEYAASARQVQTLVRRQALGDIFSQTVTSDIAMQLQFTAVYRKVPRGYVAFVEELPGANTQGTTLEEARQNLREAVELVLEANRAFAEEELAGSEVIREPLKLTA